MQKEIPVVDPAFIRKEWTAGTPENKKLLEKIYGQDFFVFGDVRDRVKSVQDACKERGKDYEKEFPKELVKLLTPDELAYREWKMVQEALNEGVEMDYSNTAQQKWEIYMKWVSGRGLSLYAVYYVYTNASVGPRLSFARQELGVYFAEQFPDILNRFYNHPKNK